MGPTMENDSAGFGTQTGFDVYCEAPQDRCIVRSVRSESHKLAAGNPILVEHSRTIFQATQWYSAASGQSLSGASWPAGTIFSGTGQGGDGKYYQIKTRGRFGGLGLTQATGGSATTISSSWANWPRRSFHRTAGHDHRRLRERRVLRRHIKHGHRYHLRERVVNELLPACNRES